MATFGFDADALNRKMQETVRTRLKERANQLAAEWQKVADGITCPTHHRTATAVVNDSSPDSPAVGFRGCCDELINTVQTAVLHKSGGDGGESPGPG